jgi:hypothetical protein
MAALGGWSEVLDGGARSQQEREITWELAALRIATLAEKSVATHSSYNWNNSSLREKVGCGGRRMVFNPSRTTLAQYGAALESEGLEPAGRVVYCCLSPPFLNLPSTPVMGEAGR